VLWVGCWAGVWVGGWVYVCMCGCAIPGAPRSGRAGMSVSQSVSQSPLMVALACCGCGGVRALGEGWVGARQSCVAVYIHHPDCDTHSHSPALPCSPPHSHARLPQISTRPKTKKTKPASALALPSGPHSSARCSRALRPSPPKVGRCVGTCVCMCVYICIYICVYMCVTYMYS
jgi:hypothetical protein